MRIKSVLFFFSRYVFFLGLMFSAQAANAQSDGLNRFALVIGNSGYKFQALSSSAANDAALVASALATRGFSVFGARDLTQENLISVLADFKDRVSPTREQNMIVVYLAGRFVQVANQNFYLPVDYEPVAPVELGKIGVRISDLQAFISSLSAKGHVLLIDSGNSVPVPLAGFRPVAGLATIKAVRNSIVGINTTPGILGADYLDPIGPYARATAEGIRRGAPTWQELFDFIRLRQLELTSGDTVASFVPSVDRLPLVFSPGSDGIKNLARLQQAPMKDEPKASAAFLLALGRGTVDALDEFNFLYPAHPLVRRSKIILSAMREARIWTQVLGDDKPGAYWAYLAIYPEGGHSDEARYRLKMLNEPLKAPADAPLLVISNPPSSIDEADIIIKRSPIALDDERLRLASAVLPYSRFIGSLDNRYRPGAILAKGKNELVRFNGWDVGPGSIQTPKLQLQ